jgi:hypothetical protein
MGQRAPSDDVASPPQYPSAGDPSTSSSIVVASRSGNMVPVAAPPSSVPTNGVSVATALGPIRGLLDYYVRGEIPNPNLTYGCPPGSWLLDPLAAQSSSRSILQTVVNRTERRPRGLRNMSMGAPTAKFSSGLGNISASLRVVAQSDTPATATIQATTRSGHIVLELVSQSSTCLRSSRMTS